MPQVALDKRIKLLAPVLKWSQMLSRSLDVSYDREADVLYISFGKPQKAHDSDFINEDIIVRQDKQGHPLGYTILHASKVVLK